MKNVKNLITLIAAVSILVTMMAGCGGQSSDRAGGSSVQPTAAPATTAAVVDPFGKYTPAITVTTTRYINSAVKFDTGNPDRASLTQNVWYNAYVDQLGIKLDYLWTPNSDQYNTKWNVSIASNDIPDMAPVSPTIYQTLVTAGLVEDMTKVYNDYASDRYKEFSGMDGGLSMNYATNGGKLLGLPYLGSQPDNSPILFIRKDWLQKVNMEAPKTIDDLTKAATAFKDAKLGGDGTYGIVMNKDLGARAIGIMNGFGAYYNIWIKDKTGKLAYGSIQPEMGNSLLKLQEMYKAGLILQDFAVKDGATTDKDIVAGKVGIMYGGFPEPIVTIQSNVNADPNAQWDVLPIPSADGSAPLVQASAAPSSYIFVKKGCEHPEAAVKMINLEFKMYDEQFDKYYIDPTDSFSLDHYRFEMSYVPWKNLDCYRAVQKAVKSGDESVLTTAQQKSKYGQVKAAMAGDRTVEGFNLIYGIPGTYNIVDAYKNNNQILINAYTALPSPTMVTAGPTLKTNLDAAMFKVIMGDDISTFNNAAAAWLKEGGDKMTQEANDWYTANNK